MNLCNLCLVWLVSKLLQSSVAAAVLENMEVQVLDNQSNKYNYTPK